MDVNAYATHRLLAAQADRLAEAAERARLAAERAESAPVAQRAEPAPAGIRRRLRLPDLGRLRPSAPLRRAGR